MSRFDCGACAHRSSPIPDWPQWHLCLKLGPQGDHMVRPHYQCTAWSPRPQPDHGPPAPQRAE